MGSKIVMVVLAFLAVGGTAYAASGGERSAIQFPTGTFAIDRTTCRFAQREVDPALGRGWVQGRVYVAYEDRRHDALDSCLRARQNRIAGCLAHIPPVVEKADHGVGNPGDEKGAAAAISGLSACVSAATGVQ